MGSLNILVAKAFYRALPIGVRALEDRRIAGELIEEEVAKVAEKFADIPNNPEAAFEYLKTVENPALNEYRIIAMLEAAGLSLYKSMADGTDNEEVKKLLAKNGQEEMGHAHRIKRVIKAVWGEDFDISDTSANPYCVSEKIVVTKDLLEQFAETEFSGEDFYEAWAAKLEDPDAARLLRQNGKEEKQHGVRLREAAALLS